MQIKNAVWKHIAPQRKRTMIGLDLEELHFKYFMHFFKEINLGKTCRILCKI